MLLNEKNKDKLWLYFISLLILLLTFILKKSILLVVLLISMVALLVFKYGFIKDNSKLKNRTIILVCISLLSYFLIIYGLGFIFGFRNNIIFRNIYGVIGNIAISLIIIICEEIIRYIYAKNTFNDRKPYFLLTLVYIILGIYVFYDLELFIGLLIIRVIIYEFLCSYLTYKVGIIPSLIIRVIVYLYIYLVPICPNIASYLNIIFDFIYAILIYFSVSKMSDKKEINKMYILFPFVIIILILAMLIFGIGKYRMVAISSSSMEPIYSRGDAVIFKKVNANEKIEVGKIIAYKKKGTFITHRVVDVAVFDNVYVYTTKGDKNNKVDDYVVYANDVFGVVKYKLSYLGYPSIWFTELLGK